MPRVRSGLSCILCLWGLSLASACGDDVTAVADSAVMDAALDADAGVGPQIPWLDEGVPPIAMTPCPAGWREVDDERVARCEPYPEGGREACAPGDAHFLGEPGCRPIGDPCPTGTFATSLPADGTVLFVDDDAAPGGDGSAAAPYGALGDIVWASLGAGTTVALGKGTYEGAIALRAGVAVVGACVAETVLTGVDAPVPSVVHVASAGAPATIRNLTILDAPNIGVRAEGGRQLIIDGVRVKGVESVGIGVGNPGSAITATNLVIEDTRAGVETGRGVVVQLGGRFEASRLLAIGNREIGVFSSGDGSTVVLEDAAVLDTLPLEGVGTGGRGITTQQGAHLEATRLLVAGNRELGMYAGDLATVTLVDGLVVDTAPRLNRSGGGRGIGVEEGARFSASRLYVARNHEVGVFAWGPGTEVSLEDAIVVDTREQASDGETGHGVHVIYGAHCDASRVLVARNRETNLLVAEPGTTMVLRDVALLDGQPQNDVRLGIGMQAALSAVVDGERVVIAGAFEVGLSVISGAIVDMEDASVSNVVAGGQTAIGAGIGAFSATASFHRFEVRDAATCGVFVASSGSVGAPPSLDLRNGVVSGSAIGACLQVDGYDLSRLTTDVAYTDNGVNLDSTSLPVPEPAGVLLR